MKAIHNILSASLVAVALQSTAFAQGADAWPKQRVSFVVGFAAGGFADTVGRIIANKLGERLNQTVVVQNMEGAGGNAAARHVSVAPADGYTFLVTTTGLAINETLYKNKQFSASAFVPVAIPVSAPETIITSKKSGFNNMADVVAGAKDNRVFLGTPGIGSGSHIAAEYFFKKVAKVEVKHIPFQGGNPALQALRTNDINILASTASVPILPPITSGEMISLGVAANERNPAMPTVPTYAEIGFPGVIANSWTGVFARADTPPVILARMNTELNEAMKDPDVLKKLEGFGLIIQRRDLSQNTAFFKEEIARWATMVEATGLSM